LGAVKRKNYDLRGHQGDHEIVKYFEIVRVVEKPVY
jgi:hypothetical protein